MEDPIFSVANSSDFMTFGDLQKKEEKKSKHYSSKSKSKVSDHVL